MKRPVYFGMAQIDHPEEIYGVHCKSCGCPFLNHVHAADRENYAEVGVCICGCKRGKFSAKKLLKFANSNRIYRIGEG